MDKTFLAVLSDLFINLSAGWFGVVVIVPNFTKEKGIKKFLILTIDIAFAIVCLVISYLLRRIV